jgi:hypothetical protein
MAVLFGACDQGTPAPIHDGSIDTPNAACAMNSPCAPGELSCSIPEMSGLTKTCSCVTTGNQPWWACSDCPFGEGNDPVACATPGLGCNITNWEHDCFCSCTASGYWDCTPGTIGSHCPKAP